MLGAPHGVHAWSVNPGWILTPLQRHLTRAGYEVLSAEDAVEAGKLVVERSPQLIIADIQLPYMSGDEFVAAVLRDLPAPALNAAEIRAINLAL